MHLPTATREVAFSIEEELGTRSEELKKQMQRDARKQVGLFNPFPAVQCS